MPAPIVLALALGLQAAPAPAPAAAASPRCPGPRLEEVEAKAAGGGRFAFSGPMRAPFLNLWRQGERPPLPVEPDSVTLLAKAGEPLVLIYARTGCALAVLRASRAEVYQALRAGIGPAV